MVHVITLGGSCLVVPLQLPEFSGALDTRGHLLHSMSCLFADVEYALAEDGNDPPTTSDRAQLAALAGKAREIEFKCTDHAPATLRSCDFRLAVISYVHSSPLHGVAQLERRVRLIVMRIKVKTLWHQGVL